MLNQTQLDLLKKSNKTLAIIGRFRSKDEQIRYVFKNTGEKDGKIRVADLFAKLKPELRSSSKGTLTIGDSIFNKYELDTPLNAKDKGNSQPILFDSLLLDGSIYSGDIADDIQKQGKEVVNKLIKNLDTVAYFTDSHFTKSLLKIAKEYLIEEANKELEHKIDEDKQWIQIINSDNSFCSRIVQYMTAHEQDEPEIETAFRLSLNSFKNNSDKRIYTEEQVDQLVEALIKCKQVMLYGIEDRTWKIIAKSSQFSWLKNYASDPDYGFSHPEVGEKNFFVYYQQFMVASSEIHRLVRTQAIHSSIFCWLSSKYKKWGNSAEQRTQAAGEMFRVGVEGQGEQRIRSESREAYLRNSELIQKAEVEPTLANKVEGDDNYLIFAEKAEDNIFDALLPDRAVTRKALRLRAKNLFKKLNQIAGGKAGQILRENDEFNQLFVKYYRTILNTQTEAEIEEFAERLNKEAAKDKEVEKFNTFDMRGFVDVVINRAKEKEGDENFKIKVKEAFISEFAQKSKNRFAEEYLKNQDQIKKEEQLAQDLYDLRSIQEVTSQEATAGAPVYVMTDLSMPDFENIDQDIKTIRKKKILQEAQTATQTNFTLSVTAPKPKKFQSIPVSKEPGEVTNGEGRKIGSYTIEEDNIKLSADEIQVADQFNSAEAQINIDGETYKLQELDIPEIMDFPKPDEIKQAERIAEDAQNNYQQLSKSMDTILSKYRDEDSKEPDFNRAFRSLLLCEYIQSAPKGTTQLGREDLSNILGLMVDIVEHLGELDDSKILDEELSKDPKLLRLLQKINLSKYYPAEKRDEISTILQYQYELCKKLNKVKNYLQELAEIKNFFEMMQHTDLEIVVLNTSLSEYNDIDYKGYDTFYTDSPSVVYLTSQSQFDDSKLTTMAGHLATFIDDTKDAENFQIPIFVSSSKDLSLDQVPLPLICPTAKFELPQFVFGNNKSPETDKLNITVDWEKQQNSYLLLSAALLNSSMPMGSIIDFKRSVSIKMRDSFDTNLSKNQTVVDLLRQFWLSRNCKLVDTLIFTKWLNLIVLAKRQDNTINIKEQFGQKLEDELLRQESLKVEKVAFSTLEQLQDIRIQVVPEGKTRLTSLNGLATEDYSMTSIYGALLDKGSSEYTFTLPWKNNFAGKLDEVKK
ncbi:hypothetical protein NIES22_65660 [Calothrix brevissima NIES-22]|nr:hypothetical protein NIES22_65660 [Calothrix brevissima NIES-22]